MISSDEPARLRRGRQGCGNSMWLKVNQIGSLRRRRAVDMRTGRALPTSFASLEETEDTTIAAISPWRTNCAADQDRSLSRSDPPRQVQPAHPIEEMLGSSQNMLAELLRADLRHPAPQRDKRGYADESFA
jgi:enolase